MHQLQNSPSGRLWPCAVGVAKARSGHPPNSFLALKDGEPLEGGLAFVKQVNSRTGTNGASAPTQRGQLDAVTATSGLKKE